LINKKTLLIYFCFCLVFNSCKKEDETQITNTSTEVEGCMDSLALNYNPLATTEPDGSCEYDNIIVEWEIVSTPSANSSTSTPKTK